MCCFANVVMLTVVLQLSVYAQRPMAMPGAGMLSPAERTEQLKDELSLTEAQTAKVKLIFKEQNKEMRKQRQQSEDERMAIGEYMMRKRKEESGPGGPQAPAHEQHE